MNDKCPLCGKSEWKIEDENMKEIQRRCKGCNIRYIIEKYDLELLDDNADHVGNVTIKVRLDV